MTLFYSLSLFVLGAFVGSFLNVLSDRLPRNESVVKGRSYCEYCKKTLSWYDLIPLLSFVQLKGKCRYCRKRLSYYYPLVELLTGLVFSSIVFLPNLQFQSSNFKFPIELFYYLYIFSSLIVIFFTDLKSGIIPDKIVFPAIIITFAYQLLITSYQLLPYLFSGLGAFLFFYFLYFVTRRRGMGFGDVKLSFLLGLALGFPGIVIALYIAFLTGACAAFILIVWRKKHFFGATIPFGPFMVAGTLINMVWGSYILDFITKVLPSLSFL